MPGSVLLSSHCVLLQIRPLEEAYKFGSFFSSLLTESDFEAKPSVLLLGQYSTGKTTFIKHLLGRDYPGIHIGPEPTTGQLRCLVKKAHDLHTHSNRFAVRCYIATINVGACIAFVL